MKVETLTPVLVAAPGGRVRCRLRVENDAPAPSGFRLRVIGFDPSHILWPPPSPPLEPGSSVELEIELAVPEAFAAGQHAIGIEVTPDRPGMAPVLAAVTLSVGRVEDVAMAVVPAVIRGNRRGRFKLDIDNRSDRPVELELSGEAPDLEIRMEPEQVTLGPGERVRTSGRISAPRLVGGDPVQHSVTIAARSRSAPVYASATFQQRPLFPRGLRLAVAMLLVIAVGAAGIFVGYRWWDAREQEARPHLVDTDGDGILDSPATEEVDTDGDGVPDTPGNELVDSDGDGVVDTPAAVVAAELAEEQAMGPPQEGGSDLPTRATLGGTVAAGDGGQAEGVNVTLTPVDLGAPLPERATQLGFRNGRLVEVEGFGGGKLWPARFGRYDPVIRTGIRQTESVPDVTTTDERGVWFFGGITIGQSYEVAFSQPGFDTQAFIVTPDASGKPIDLPVELQPARGAVRGTVSGPNGPLGNVELVLSDGDLVFNSASASAGEVGTFEFTGVSTPGTYTLTATAPGLGTEVVQVTLEPGEQRSGVDIRMSAGVGSISGRITEAGQPLGGVTLTASNGETTVTTTSLTEGATGTYLFPRLEIPGRYTITASLEGYMTQTRVVNLTGNATGVDFDMVKRTGTIVGLVESSNGGGLPGVNVRVSRDELAFDTQTAVAPDAGAFTIPDLPPGTYLVEFSRYDHAEHSVTVTVAAGQVVDLGRIVLQFRPRPDIEQNATLQVDIVDSKNEPLPGATVRVTRASDNRLVGEQVGTAEQTRFLFRQMAIGTYRIEVTKDATYRPSIRTVSIGTGNLPITIPLYRMGQVSGRLIDSFTKQDLQDYDIQIFRLTASGDREPTPVQNIPVRNREPDENGQIIWEAAPDSLTTGIYEVHVVNPPPGYSVTPDQVLVPGELPMRFRILPDDDTPIRLNPIEADRFPEVSGVVLTPQRSATGGVEFVPIDAPELRVALTCPGANGVPSTLTLTTAAPPTLPPAPPATGLGEIPGSAIGFDTFFIDPVTLDDHDLFGECTLQVAVGDDFELDDTDEYVPVELDVTVAPGDGSRNPVVIRNVALFRPEDVGGTVYWVDDGVTPPEPVPASGVSVQTQGPVTIGMTPGTVPYDSTGSEPGLIEAPLPETFTDDGGNWAYLDPKQVFGDGFYIFSDPRYESRLIRLRIDENGKQATGIQPPGEPPAVSDDGTSIELDARGGQITGALVIRTSRTQPVDVSGFTADLTGADDIADQTFTAASQAGAGVQRATTTFVTDDPGTHRWSIDAPAPGSDGRPRFVPVDGAEQPSAPFRQLPGENLDFNSRPELVKTYAEMGALRLVVQDSLGNPIPNVTGTLTPLGGGDPISFATGGDGTVTVEAIPVSTALFGTGTYNVQLAAGQPLDLPQALFLVEGAVNGPFLCPGNGCADVEIAQGAQPVVTIRVPEYGAIIGQVFGDDGVRDPDTGKPVFRDLINDPRLVVTARRIANIACVVDDDGPDVTATRVDADGDGTIDSFRVSGPPGVYRISFEHEDYQSDPTEGPAPDCRDGSGNPTDPAFDGFVYIVRNDVERELEAPFFTLLIKPSTVVVDVVHDRIQAPDPVTDVGAGVDGATVTITGLKTVTGTTDSDGRIVFQEESDTVDNSLPPGAYTVTVSSTTPPGVPAYFPISFSLSIPPGGGQVDLVVPLSRIGASLEGLVGAVNSEGTPVQPPSGIAVTAEVDLFDPQATNATVGTLANPTDELTATVTPAPPSEGPAGPYRFRFDNLVSGTYDLTFSEPAASSGYLPPDPNPVGSPTVPLVLGPFPHTISQRINYRAVDRTVVVTVTKPSAAPIEAVVRLVDPAGNPTTEQRVQCGASCTATFANVPPEVDAYDVEVTMARHAMADPDLTVTVPPGNPAQNVTVTAAMTPTVATVRGEAEIRSSMTDPQQPLPTEGVVALYRDGETDPLARSNGSEYSFDIDSRGSYYVEVTNTGYAPRRVPFRVDALAAGGAVDLGGELTLQTIVVPRLATYRINIAGLASNTSATVRPIVATGTPTVPPAVTPVDGVPTVVVDPGLGEPAPSPRPAYRFEVSTTEGFVPITVPDSGDQINIGETKDVPATFGPGARRQLIATIAGADTVGAVAKAVSASGEQIDGTVSGNEATITGVSAGTWTVHVAQLGRGIGASAGVTIDATDGHVSAPAPIVLSPRNVAITFNVTPPNATVALAGGPAVQATNGSVTITRAENAAFPLAYTVSAPGYVEQSGSVQRPTPSDPYDPELATTVPPINLVPLIDAVVMSEGAAVSNAQVFLCPGSVTTCNGSTANRIAMPFVDDDDVYRAAATGSGPFTIGATVGSRSAVETLTVNANGTLSRSLPITVTLPDPPPPDPPPTSDSTPGP